jgi:GT2 family glycosyltransferase
VVSVVVASIGRPSVGETLRSIGEAVRSAGVVAETILVWQSTDPYPALQGRGQVVEAFPVGLSYARNRGIEASSGEIVAFIDDDEVADRSWIEGLLKTLSQPPYPAAVCGAILPLDDRGHAHVRSAGAHVRVFRGRGTAPWYVGAGGNMAIRRDRLELLRGFNLSFGLGSHGLSAEDTDIVVRLLRAGETVVWTPNAPVYHPTKTTEERLQTRYPYGYGLARLVRRHRAPELLAQYTKGFLAAAAASRRDVRLRRELLASGGGFLAGLLRGAPGAPPKRFLERMPDELWQTLDLDGIVPLRAGYRPDPHVVYRAGDDIVHLYVNPGERLRQALQARDAIRRDVQVGVPAPLAVVEGIDSLWVLEERLPGQPPPLRRADEWFTRGAEWAVELAGPPGRALRQTGWWAGRRSEVEEAAPAELRDRVACALEEIGDLPSRHLHGDLSRKNLLLASERVGAVDWETCRVEGPPGLDLLFLALTAQRSGPDEKVPAALLAGRDPSFGPVRALLRRAGVPDGRQRAALLVALAVWAADERRRHAQLGTYDTTPIFGRLLAKWDHAVL